ncbi:MAG: terminase family protein [Bacteroidaceae bacterium]|nr:terminase family protein [Bacteroidaceae bacterium]
MISNKLTKSSGYELEVKKQEMNDIWNTKRVNEALDAIDNGIPLKSSPFFMKNVNLRKPNLVYDYTQYELDEITKCANDICYFADTYCKVMTDDGVQKIKLRDYQRAMLKHYQNNRFAICLAARQVGKTICSSIFIAWYSLFNFDKNVMIVSNKGETTKEIIDKGKVIFENLPFFLKPGILKWDVMSEKFDNGCRVVGQNTTKRTGISFTIHLLFLDEFAHVDPSFINPFYENLYPTLSSSKISRIIITSTPNGMNKFFDIYTGAENGDNDYGAFRVDWWEVPGRDDAWYRRELKNLGSVEAFNRQYGNSFLDENELLLSSDTLKFLEKSKIKFVHHDISILDDYELDYKNLLWDPRFDIETIRDDNRYYLFSIDISEGAGGEDPDFSVINIFKLQPLPRKWIEKSNATTVYDYFGLRQIGRLHDKDLTVGQLAQIAYLLTHHVFDIEHVKILIEWNLFGSELMKDMSTCFPSINDFDESAVLRFKHRNDAKVSEYGLKIKNDNKIIFCQDFKLFASKHRIEVVDKDTVLEAKTFGKVKNSFKAQVGHDDLMMSSINAINFFKTVEYADFVEEYLDKITPETYNLIMTKLDMQGGAQEDLNNYDIYSLLEK